MSITGTLAINTIYWAVFDGFKHPTLGDDDKNVEPSLEFFTSAGAHTNTGIDYDYTVVEETLVNINNIAPPTWDSLVVGQTNIGFIIKF